MKLSLKYPGVILVIIALSNGIHAGANEDINALLNGFHKAAFTSQ